MFLLELILLTSALQSWDIDLGLAQDERLLTGSIITPIAARISMGIIRLKAA